LRRPISLQSVSKEMGISIKLDLVWKKIDCHLFSYLRRLSETIHFLFVTLFVYDPFLIWDAYLRRSISYFRHCLFTIHFSSERLKKDGYHVSSCPIWMSHVPYEWVMFHMNESCPIWIRHVPYELGMSHMNEACPIWIRHVPYELGMSHMNESCPIWMSHVPYEWVMSHMNESCPIW